MLIQDLTSASPHITSTLKSGKHVTISSIFAYLRERNDLYWIGDFPIISFIVTKIFNSGKELNASEIVKTFKRSDELKVYGRSNNILVRSLATKHFA